MHRLSAHIAKRFERNWDAHQGPEFASAVLADVAHLVESVAEESALNAGATKRKLPQAEYVAFVMELTLELEKARARGASGATALRLIEDACASMGLIKPPKRPGPKAVS